MSLIQTRFDRSSLGFSVQCCVLLLFVSIVACKPKDPLSDIHVTSQPSELYLEKEKIRKLLGTPSISIRNWEETDETTPGLIKTTVEGTDDIIYVHPNFIAENRHIRSVTLEKSKSGSGFDTVILFWNEGEERMSIETSTETNANIALLLDGRVEHAVTLETKFARRMVFSFEDLESAVALLEKINFCRNGNIEPIISGRRLRSKLIAFLVIAAIGLSMVCFITWRR